MVRRCTGGPAGGFSLVEVLVAVVVLSLGLLGLAGLQLSSLRNTHSATQRFDAAQFAYDILDRMRANRPQALAGDYNVTTGESVTGSDPASIDLSAWKGSLARVLPNGDGMIEVNNRVVTVTVQWTEDWDLNNPDAAKAARVLVRTQL